MRLPVVPCLVLLSACTGETGFHNANPDDDNQDGDAQAGITPSLLEFVDLSLATAKSEYVQVLSSGDANLVIYQIVVNDSAGGVFFCNEEVDLTLAPGLSHEFPVTATLHAEGYVEGTLRIRTNDADATALDFPLHAWTEGYGPSDTGPADS